MIYGQYLQTCFDPKILSQHINNCCKVLRPHADKFDAIAFRGLSGSMVAPCVALQLGKYLIAVRKEPTHSICEVEGYAGTQSYIIIDDFIDTGRTLLHIKDEIQKWQKKLDKSPGHLHAVALYLENPEDTMRAAQFDRALPGVIHLPCKNINLNPE